MLKRSVLFCDASLRTWDGGTSDVTSELLVVNIWLNRYASLTTGMRYEKYVVRRFRRCANVIECT